MGTRISGETLSLVASAQAANFTMVVPIGYAVKDIYVKNNTANAITGGLRIGTTDGGVDVLVALAVGANAFTIGVPLVKVFSASATQTLFLQAVVGWNSATVDVVISLEKAIP